MSAAIAEPRRVPVSVVVLTCNEQRNLAACLESVRDWTTEVFVVDSGSSDDTLAIASRYGVSTVVHPFTTHALQWIWALAELPIRTDWVLALDADQRVTSELKHEIAVVLNGFAEHSNAPAGFYIRRRQMFRGRWIRYGGYYPKYLLKLFRRDAVVIDHEELVDHHFGVRGRTECLRRDIVEENLNEATIATWIDKHNRYARLQALEEHRSTRRDDSGASPFGSADERTRWLKMYWSKLPLYVRPCVYFVYRYVLRFGFLDGREGFIFHVLQAFWYRLLVDINRDELRTADLSATVTVDSPSQETAQL